LGPAPDPVPPFWVGWGGGVGARHDRRSKRPPLTLTLSP
jgi:hypothetical protein